MVMPLYDDNPFKLPHRPIVTWLLIAANLLVFLVELSSGNPEGLVVHYGLTPGALSGDITIPGAPAATLTLVSYMFLHADWMHIFGNMIFLWVFGDDIEECLGRWKYLGFYLACGVIGGLVFAVNDLHAQTPLIGASGAIAGIVIAYVMLRPCAKVTVLMFGIPMRISAYWVIGLFVFIQLVNLSSASKSDVAYWCHFGGMVAAAVLFPFIRPAGVKLFECIRPTKTPAVVTAQMPNSSHLPGAPHGGG